MTREQAPLYVPLVQALADGKIQYDPAGDGSWKDIDQVSFREPPERYRRKPEPRFEPYTLETFPRDGWYRYKGAIPSVPMRALAVRDRAVEFYGSGIVTFESLLQFWQHEDGTPCGKEAL